MLNVCTLKLSRISLRLNVIHFDLIAALKIHMSYSTMEILKTQGSFIIEDRGNIEVKVCTHFVIVYGIDSYYY